MVSHCVDPNISIRDDDLWLELQKYNNVDMLTTYANGYVITAV